MRKVTSLPLTGRLSNRRSLTSSLGPSWKLRPSADPYRTRLPQPKGYVSFSDEPTGVQGPRALARPAIKALTRMPWFAPFGVATAGRYVMRILDQVTRYLTDDEIRANAKAAVIDLIDADTKIVIGHSLGSVVAYEALFDTEHPVALITLGSPLGLRQVVYERLRPQPPATPPSATAWTNVADIDDLVAATTELRPLFPPSPNRGPIPMTDRRADNGAKPHSAEHYLGKQSVGSATAAAIT